MAMPRRRSGSKRVILYSGKTERMERSAERPVGVDVGAADDDEEEEDDEEEADDEDVVVDDDDDDDDDDDAGADDDAVGGPVARTMAA
jgi:hypothetical protein